MIKHFFRILVTSIEIYIFLISYVMSFFFLDFYNSLYYLVFPSSSTDAKYIALGSIFSLILIPSIYSSQKILFPKDENKKLLEYEKYPLIKMTVYWGILWEILCIILIVVSVANPNFFKIVSRIVVSSTVSGLTCMISLFIASNKIREIIEINN